jgi:hypothetical protein
LQALQERLDAPAPSPRPSAARGMAPAIMTILKRCAWAASSWSQHTLDVSWREAFTWKHDPQGCSFRGPAALVMLCPGPVLRARSPDHHCQDTHTRRAAARAVWRARRRLQHHGSLQEASDAARLLSHTARACDDTPERTRVVGLVARLSHGAVQTHRQRVQSRATRVRGNKGPTWHEDARQGKAREVTGPADEEDERQPNPQHS